MISNLPPFRYAWVLPIVVCWATAAIADTPYVHLEVSPSNVALTGSRAAAQILVTAHHRDGHTIDVTRQAQFGDSELVTSEGGYLRARQNGVVIVTAQSPVTQNTVVVSESNGTCGCFKMAK